MTFTETLSANFIKFKEKDLIVDCRHCHVHKFSGFYLLFQVLDAPSIINHGNLKLRLRSSTFNRTYLIFQKMPLNVARNNTGR